MWKEIREEQHSIYMLNFKLKERIPFVRKKESTLLEPFLQVLHGRLPSINLLIYKLKIENSMRFFFVFFSFPDLWNCRNGTWNEGGLCDINVGPETNYKNLEADPLNNLYIYNAIKEMAHGNWNVHYLNVTHLTEFRKDGHPSKYREPGTPPFAPQDCSHWCLPGVPDTWNDLLYAYLVSKDYRTK